MSYDFSKLSRVPINNSVSNETFSLVVNQDEVEKTPYGNVVSNVKDYTDDYNSYLSAHPGTSPIDYIRTLTPILNDTQSIPREGYFTYLYYYYTFEVFINTSTTWYKITEVNTNQQKLTEYVYNPTSLVEQVEKNYNIANPTSGTRFVTPVEFDSVREINCSGNVDIDGSLNVDGNSTFNGVSVSTVHIGGINAPYIDIDSNSIDFTGANTGVQISHDGNGNIVVSEGSSNTKITGLSNPTVQTDAANKRYVDTNIAELNGRINNLIIGGDSTEGEETIVMTYVVAVLNDTATKTVSPWNTNYKIISCMWSLQGSTYNWIDDGLVITISSNVPTLTVENVSNYVTVPENAYVVFRLVCSRPANLIVPELVDLRQPFNYTGTWPPADYDPDSQGYVYGDYVTYNDVIYMCIEEQQLVSGSWNPDYWTPVTARLNIQEALNYRLRLGGQDTMQGNLKMGNHLISGVASPVNGTDAATKSYVDNKTFSLDANGILSFG